MALLCVVHFFVTFPYGFPVQVWYLIVSIPDLCLPLYLNCNSEILFYINFGIQHAK